MLLEKVLQCCRGKAGLGQLRAYSTIRSFYVKEKTVRELDREALSENKGGLRVRYIDPDDQDMNEPNTERQELREEERELLRLKKKAKKLSEKMRYARINPHNKRLEYTHEDNPSSLNFTNLMKHYNLMESRATSNNWSGGYQARRFAKKLESTQVSVRTSLNPSPELSSVYQAADIMGTLHDNNKKYTLNEALKCYDDTVERKGVMHADQSVRYTYMMTALADVVLSNRRIIDELSAYFNQLVEDGQEVDGQEIVKLLNSKLEQLQLSSELFGNNFDVEQDSTKEEVDRGVENEARNKEEVDKKVLDLYNEILWNDVEHKKRLEQFFLEHFASTKYDEIFKDPTDNEDHLYTPKALPHKLVPAKYLKSDTSVESIKERSIFQSTSDNPLRDIRAWNTTFENMIAKAVRLIHRHHVYIYNLETCKKLLYICHSTRNTADQDPESLFEQMLTVSLYCEKDDRIKNKPYHINEFKRIQEAELDGVEYEFSTDKSRRYKASKSYFRKSSQ
ncbi:hypothetical protein AKO1_009534 [Acrasis kona]|uniref:Uncharacterized protein n=1 Tax=Acrasis kona TaxID=1008807 RepID=A0AAW2ZLW4_9EUKA